MKKNIRALKNVKPTMTSIDQIKKQSTIRSDEKLKKQVTISTNEQMIEEYSYEFSTDPVTSGVNSVRGRVKLPPLKATQQQNKHHSKKRNISQKHHSKKKKNKVTEKIEKTP
jgi:hypothetical protein